MVTENVTAESIVLLNYDVIATTSQKFNGEIIRSKCRALVNRGSLYHVIFLYKTNLVLSLRVSVADLENDVQLWGQSVQQQRLDVKIEGFLSSYCCYIDVYLVIY